MIRKIKKLTAAQWLLVGSGVALAAAISVVVFFSIRGSIDWNAGLGIEMQGANRSWFYFGVFLLIGLPLAAIPLYVRRFCQKRPCRKCGKRHIQHI